jgi:hypothetical protein
MRELQAAGQLHIMFAWMPCPEAIGGCMCKQGLDSVNKCGNTSPPNCHPHPTGSQLRVRTAVPRATYMMCVQDSLHLHATASENPCGYWKAHLLLVRLSLPLSAASAHAHSVCMSVLPVHTSMMAALHCSLRSAGGRNPACYAVTHALVPDDPFADEPACPQPRGSDCRPSMLISAQLSPLTLNTIKGVRLDVSN